MNPRMNPRELVDYIRSGPTELKLDEPLRFLRQKRSHICDFSEFIQALQSNETIQSVNCDSHHELSITEEEWVHLVKTLGSIKGIQRLNLLCTHGSHNFHPPLQGVADAVNNAQSLLTLQFLALRHVDQSGIVALADALRQHPALERFIGNDFRSVQKAQQDTSLDPVLQALLACPHLCKVAIRTKCASADALRNLLHVHRGSRT
jgi:hypothetical protein